jgi:hypothetical protein
MLEISNFKSQNYCYLSLGYAVSIKEYLSE